MKRILLGLVGTIAVAQPSAAQSLFATRGLGLPVPAVDARARALGGIGVGLLGLNTSLISPAEVSGLGRRGVTAALQPASASPEVDGQTGDLSASRFPLIRFIYPLSSRWVATLGYGSLLEQSWGVTLTGTELIGEDTVGVTDVVQSTGGVARLAFGLAYQVSPALAIGAGAGVHTGNLDRRIQRTFSDSAVALLPFETRLRWHYDGTFVTGGIRLDMQQVARAGASVTINQNLDIEGRDDEARSDRSDMPMVVNAGASGVLSSTLLGAVGAEWSGGGSERVFGSADATALRRNTWRLGGGFEYDGLGSSRRTFPMRLGASWAQLPYYNEGETPASEWSGSFGLGFRLAGDEAGPLAVVDISVERGGRSGLESTRLPAGLKESFWRFTFSLSLFGT